MLFWGIWRKDLWYLINLQGHGHNFLCTEILDAMETGEGGEAKWSGGVGGRWKITTCLREAKIQYRWCYPFKLLFAQGEQQHITKDEAEGVKVLCRLKLLKDYSAQPRQLLKHGMASGQQQKGRPWKLKIGNLKQSFQATDLQKASVEMDNRNGISN